MCLSLEVLSLPGISDEDLSEEEDFNKAEFVGTTAVILLGASAFLYLIISGPEVRGIPRSGQSEDIDDILRSPSQSKDEYLKQRLENYKERIEGNHEIIKSIEGTAALAGTCFGIAMISLLVLFFSLFFGPIGIIKVVLFAILYILFFYNLRQQLPDSYLQKETILGRSNDSD